MAHEVLVELGLLGQIAHCEIALPEWMVQHLLPAEPVHWILGEQPLHQIVKRRREALHLGHIFVNDLADQVLEHVAFKRRLAGCELVQHDT